MATLEEIKRKKLEEMMNFQQQQSEGQSQIQHQIGQMESAVRQFLSKEALSRYGSLKAAHQEKALQLLVVLFQAIQKGQIKGKIEDALLKKVLEQLSPAKKEFNIRRV